MDDSLRGARVLVVEDDPGLLALLGAELEEAGLEVCQADSAEAALEVSAQQSPDLVVSDVRLPGASGLDLLSTYLDGPQPPAFIAITAFGTVHQAVQAIKRGADDFITKPIDLDHFMLAVKKAIGVRRMRHELERIREQRVSGGFHDMVGQSQPMQRLYEQIRLAAKGEGAVLIAGESGCGKELVAKSLHAESSRSAGPFLAVNCAGIPEHLLESEFFGHTAGAYTGAASTRKGLFVEASGGSMLLDEIGEMPLPLQAKLLRVIEDGKVRPVGGDREYRVDVRILAATNKDLHQEVNAKRFRGDLFYRLDTFSLEVPPLRDRGQDIDLLAAFFLRRHAQRLDKNVECFSDEALEKLRRYRYPGNVRELENAIERSVAFCATDEIRQQNLPARIRHHRNHHDAGLRLSSYFDPAEGLPTFDELRQRYVEYILKRTDGNKRRAAALLGVGRRTLYRWLNLEEED